MNRSSFLYRAVVSWLRKFTEAYRFPGLCGDFEEMYASQRKKSRFHADFWLIGQALRLGPHYYREHTFWRMVMLKNYLKTTLRNILKYKVYSLINIIGLTVGMSCCIFILIWVRDELSFDRFHQHADTLYRVIETEALSDGRVLTYSVLPAALAGILKSEYPEVLEVARYKTLGTRVIQFGDTRFYETGFAFADPELLNLFTFPFTKGNSGSALSEPGSVVITEEMGKRYFGNEDPIGKTLRVDDRLDFKVTGVLRNIPTNSHMRFNFVVPFETIANYDRDIEGWDSWAYNTYLQLEKGIDYIEF